MKKTYLIENHGVGWFPSPEFEILSEESGRHMYTVKEDVGAFSATDVRSGHEVATVEDNTYGSWFGNFSYSIESGSTRADINESSALCGPTSFRLKSNKGWRCTFEKEFALCSPIEYDVHIRTPIDKERCTLADITEVCGFCTYCVTFDDLDDEEFRLTFLVGCAMVQYYDIQKRENSAQP